MWLALGTFVGWFGWFFFNGGSTYSLYSSIDSAKVIVNTTVAAATAAGTVYFVRKPIFLFVCKCF